MMASRSWVPFGGVGILKIVSSNPSAAAPLVGSMSSWLLRIASKPLLSLATARSRNRARSLPFTVPARKLKSWRLRLFSSSDSCAMLTALADAMWRSMFSWYAASLVMRYWIAENFQSLHNLLSSSGRPVKSSFFGLDASPAAWDLLISASAAVAAWAAL